MKTLSKSRLNCIYLINYLIELGRIRLCLSYFAKRSKQKVQSVDMERELRQDLLSVDTSRVNPNTHQISPLFGKIVCVGHKIPIKHTDFSSVYEYSCLCCNEYQWVSFHFWETYWKHMQHSFFIWCYLKAAIICFRNYLGAASAPGCRCSASPSLVKWTWTGMDMQVQLPHPQM